MRRIDGLDDTKQSISAKGWRSLCMGQHENGTPRGSDTTWSGWRVFVGIVGPDGVTADQRWLITRREAFLLLVRSKLAEICQQLKEKNPKVKKPRVKKMTIFDLESLAEQWLQTIDNGQSWEGVLNFLASKDGMTAEQLEVLINDWLGKSPMTGKPRSVSTIYRVCARSGVRFSRKKTFSSSQVTKIFHRIQKTR